MTLTRFFRTCSTAASCAFFATMSMADLTSAEARQLEQLRGTPVVSVDGAIVGAIEGASVTGDRASLFLRASPGSLFRTRNEDIVVRTVTSEIELRPGAIVLNSDEQRIRIKATRFKRDDDVIDINLPRR